MRAHRRDRRNRQHAVACRRCITHLKHQRRQLPVLTPRPGWCPHRSATRQHHHQLRGSRAVQWQQWQELRDYDAGATTTCTAMHMRGVANPLTCTLLGEPVEVTFLTCPMLVPCGPMGWRGPVAHRALLQPFCLYTTKLVTSNTAVACRQSITPAAPALSSSSADSAPWLAVPAPCCSFSFSSSAGCAMAARQGDRQVIMVCNNMAAGECICLATIASTVVPTACRKARTCQC